MKFRFEAPKQKPKVSVEAEVTEQQIKTGLAKLYQFIKNKLPFRLEVSKHGESKCQD